jgi:hypothetical protein
VTLILGFWLERIHARYVVGHCQVSGWVHMRYPIEKYPGRFGLEFEDRRNSAMEACCSNPLVARVNSFQVAARLKM